MEEAGQGIELECGIFLIIPRAAQSRNETLLTCSFLSFARKNTYKMAKNSCHLNDNNSRYQISTHRCKLVKFESFRTPSIHKDRKISQKPFTVKIFFETNNIFPIRRKNHFIACVQTSCDTPCQKTMCG